MILFISAFSLLDIFWQVFILMRMYKERHRLERMVKTITEYHTPSSNLVRKLCVMLLLHPPMVSTLVYFIRFRFCSLSTQFDQLINWWKSCKGFWYSQVSRSIDRKSMSLWLQSMWRNWRNYCSACPRLHWRRHLTDLHPRPLNP